MRWLVAIALSGCIASESVLCTDGTICPTGTSCKLLTDPTEGLCATPDQLAACTGKPQADPCTLAGAAMAFCNDGVCLQAVCGNGRVDPNEACDDGNVTTGDGCSADCTSNETCGNHVVDLVAGEICDDGNFLDHDGCSSTCQLEALHWIEHTLTPPVRWTGSAAYDPRRDRLVVFGGQALVAGGALVDTWEWTGADWIKRAGLEPTTRTGATMAFDGQHVILYGGAGLADTWTYDGLTWSPLQLATNPGVRSHAAMAYDSRRRRVVLFGGASTADTWEWDGTSWAMAGPAHSPPARQNGFMMAYDPVRGVIVLADGNIADTWVYDGVDWRNRTPASGAVPPVFGTMAFDTASARMIAFGGGGTNHTRAWDGTSWTDLGLAVQPPPRQFQQMASTESRIVLYGGMDTSGVRGDTWIFEAGAWTQPKTPGRFGKVVDDPMHVRIVMFGGQDSTGTYPTDTWELTSRGWLQHTGGTAPTAASVMSYDPASRDVVLLTSPPAAFQTWVWDGASWTQRHPSPAPSGFGGMAFDGHRMTMFGGAGFGLPPTAETWSWDGTTWTQVMPIDSPPASFATSIAYDPVRDQLVLFGIRNTTLTTDDTWTYDGTDWKLHADVVTRPPTGGELVWNPARQRLVLVTLFDTWEWDGSGWSHDSAADPPDGSIQFYSTSSLDGAGVMIHGGLANPFPTTDEWWEQRWDGRGLDERCDGSDLDGDHLDRCADPDCWTVCTPLCGPGTTCPPGAPTCGDGVCDPDHETCRTCPADCTCTPTCGDFFCDTGETAASCPGDCP